ncbi:PFGI-1 class ICE element type IV pilus protein PilL2 [Litchfieldella anticariensis]|nr:hypothetical protein [Halomonas anticariensis]
MTSTQHDVAKDFPTVEVWRSSRYQLVTTSATLAQRDLLEQLVQLRFPGTIPATVEDALRQTLRDTGFTLCPPQGVPQSLLYGNPLPAVHRRLGPMPLREALTVLAGSTWEMQVDPIARLVCYRLRDQPLAMRR